MLLNSISSFSFQDDLVPIFKCPQCPLMAAVSGLALDQNTDNVFAMRCFHSQAAAYFAGDWDSHWTIGDIEDTDESFKVVCNPDLSIQQLRDDSLFLGAYHKDGVVSLLFTVSAKQKFPFCAKCPSKKCKCFQQFQKTLEN